jgi:D-tyrosyl-tRNA(Tyr) deacylase
LYADTRKGRRPAFTDAATPQVADQLVNEFIQALSGFGITTSSGVFGAHMIVKIVNDGPVTIMLEI